MAEIEVQCDVPLAEPIVLATQADTRYAPIQWKLSSGDQVVIRMDAPEAAAQAHYAEHSSTLNYFVNTRVEKLVAVLTVANVSAMDISRLLGTNTAEETFHAHFETSSGALDFDYQSAEELGRRVAQDIKEAANTLVRWVRINYGQHWLKAAGADEPDIQNFLDSAKARWQRNGVWTPLVVSPRVVRIPGGVVGGTRQYLEVSDWSTIQIAVGKGESPSEAYALVSDAKERFEQGDKHIAVLHLNSAMEYAVDRFIEDQLGPKVPTASLKNVLKENYDRLLSNWVLPLSDELNLDLRTHEWPSIKRIQELRRESGHPTVNTGIATLDKIEWFRLVKEATSAISKLTGTVPPKSPHPMWAALQSGTG
jgi:HEPN domain-containing protein